MQSNSLLTAWVSRRRREVVCTENLMGAAKGGRLWAPRDGKPVLLAVIVGLDDDNFTEIVKRDLKPGDQVIVFGTSASAGSLSAGAQPRL